MEAQDPGSTKGFPGGQAFINWETGLLLDSKKRHVGFRGSLQRCVQPEEHQAREPPPSNVALHQGVEMAQGVQ